MSSSAGEYLDKMKKHVSAHKSMYMVLMVVFVVYLIYLTISLSRKLSACKKTSSFHGNQRLWQLGNGNAGSVGDFGSGSTTESQSSVYHMSSPPSQPHSNLAASVEACSLKALGSDVGADYCGALSEYQLQEMMRLQSAP
jgi:hypothetical protein